MLVLQQVRRAIGVMKENEKIKEWYNTLFNERLKLNENVFFIINNISNQKNMEKIKQAIIYENYRILNIRNVTNSQRYIEKLYK